MSSKIIIRFKKVGIGVFLYNKMSTGNNAYNNRIVCHCYTYIVTIIIIFILLRMSL